MSLSIKEKGILKNEIERISKKLNSSGLEFQRTTLTGDNDVIYKVLMENYCGEYLSDDEFFPIHFKFHLERGIKMLKSEVEMAGNLENVVKKMFKIEGELNDLF